MSMSTSELFVQQELERAEIVLRRIRFVSVFGTILLGGYFLGLGSAVKQLLQPDIAASIAKSYIQDRAEDRLPEITSYLSGQLPVMIRHMPDVVQNEIPTFRKLLFERNQIAARSHFGAQSHSFSRAFDSFFLENQPEIVGIIKGGNKPIEIEGLAFKFQGNMERWTTDSGWPASSAEANQNISEFAGRLHRLCTSSSLTHIEKRQKQALSGMMGEFYRQQKSKVASR